MAGFQLLKLGCVANLKRHFSLARQWRGLATRYDKIPITYRAASILRLHRLDARIGAETPRQPGVRTQNSLPSESARHTHGTSPWPTSASVAPRARSRATSAA